MAISAREKYLLNKMNSIAHDVQLGTLIENAESVVASEIALANGSILIGNGSGIAAANAVSGDITLSNTGVAAIAAGAVVNADVSASAAIDFSKLAALPSAQILVGNGSNVATAVAVTGDVTISNAGVTAIGANKVLASMISSTDALKVQKISVGYAALVAAGTGVAALFGTAIPDNAIIKRVYYDVTTTFAGDGDDSSTIKIGLEDQDNDVVAAVAISNGGNPWDIGLHEGIQDGAMANALKLTAARQLAVTWTAVATDTTLSAGAMDVFIEWVQGA